MRSENASDRQEYVIFEIDEFEGITAFDRMEQFLLWCKAQGIGVKQLIGSWKGQQNTAYIVNAKYEARLWRTWCIKQEAILHLTAIDAGGNRWASLHHRYECPSMLGKWQHVTEEGAKQEDGWTYDPTENAYWVARDHAA